MSLRHTLAHIAGRLLARSAVLDPERLTNGVPCREWTGKSKRGGYARIWDGERLVDAHRLSYEVNKGPIPLGKDVCHHCDVTGCIEPAHLWAGSEAENTADMIAKGRHWAGRLVTARKLIGRPSTRRGRHNVKARLNESQVREILRDGRRGTVIAAEYGISASLVYGIKGGRNWGWLGLPSIPVGGKGAHPGHLRFAQRALLDEGAEK